MKTGIKQPKFKVRRGDTVEVIAGKEKGKRGTIKKVLLKDARVIVENVNVVTRHIRPDYRYPQGSFQKELPIHISNIALVDPETNKPGRVGFKTDADGNKVRYFKKTGTVLPRV